jgi:hypothetical protein
MNTTVKRTFTERERKIRGRREINRDGDEEQ